MNITYIRDFVHESNKIEGIVRPVTAAEFNATVDFMRLRTIQVKDVEDLVKVYARARLRNLVGLDVFVGDHRPPFGGPRIKTHLEGILERANSDNEHPYLIHHDYETLHPFTDGNGRSGRALWAWMMVNQKIWPELKLGFLHAWYYQSLQHGQSRVEQ